MIAPMTRQNASTEIVFTNTCLFVGQVTFFSSEAIPLKKEAIFEPILLKIFGFFLLSAAIITHP